MTKKIEYIIEISSDYQIQCSIIDKYNNQIPITIDTSQQ